MIEQLSIWLLEPMEYTFMQRALIASLIVGINCGALGSILILKRLALMGDAIAHAVLPGVAIAYLIGINFFWGAVTTGVITALAIGFVTEHSKIKEDSAIGIMFSAAFALGILIMSNIHTGVDLFHILFGNVLGVSAGDLKLIAILALLVITLIILFFKELKLFIFDHILARSIGLPTSLIHYLLMLMLSLTVVASLQTVGIVLVVAMLITPGATAYLLVNRLSTMMVLAAFFGLISAVIGLYLSFYLNVASGAAIVVVATIFFLLALFLSPKEGILTTKKIFGN
ncbi:metal ABC transporter permease [Fuchsiella alkaliacetigena]|uniref:metal ABC transporter permease n=1 Tax=Fuchsiella alkaliacetigena TaxID=957042 RepID=UPI00200ABC67|nr:metal ABC transporter permease [Fuchsiella alkaliacetigena]MCK8825203.1 metal ABC transporter permease [Fuchsiella alkaliacetigena]